MAITFEIDIGETLASSRLAGVVSHIPFRSLNSETVAEETQSSAIAAFGGRTVGYFVTSATAVTQRVLHCDTPILGSLLDTAMMLNQERLRLPRGVLGAECAFGFIIGAPYPDPHQDITRSAVERIIIGCEPMITVLGRRVPAAIPLNSWTATADFALHVASVKGPPVFDLRFEDLPGTEVVATIDGAVMGRGIGGDIMGDPLEGVIWVAKALKARGRQLSPGNIVAVGGCAGLFQVLPGQVFKADFAELGSVEAAFD